MQNLIFVSAHEGVSQKSGRPYSMVRLSDGMDSFTVTKHKDCDVSRFVEGDEVQCVFEIKKGFDGGVRATLIKIN